MAVKDLQARQGNVTITLDIIEKQPVREFEKFGRKGKVCNCIGQDETGKVKISLWNDDIDKVNEGDKVKIDNGWVSEWQGELQLSTGKFGKIEVIGKSEVQPAAKPIDEPKPVKSQEKKKSSKDEVIEEDLEDLGEDSYTEEIDFEE